MTSSSTDLRTTESRTTEAKDSVVVEVHDTLQVVTVVTVDRNEAGDTVRVSTVTDRERVRDRSAVRAQEKRVEVRVDTVYVEKRDSVYVQNTNLANPTNKKSGFLTYIKWIFALVFAIVGLVVVIRLKC